MKRLRSLPFWSIMYFLSLGKGRRSNAHDIGFPQGSSGVGPKGWGNLTRQSPLVQVILNGKSLLITSSYDLDSFYWGDFLWQSLCNLFAHDRKQRYSLLTADVFPVVASLSPEGERNDRKYICGSQAKTKTTKFWIPHPYFIWSYNNVVSSPFLRDTEPNPSLCFSQFFSLIGSCPQSPSFLGHVWLAQRPTLGWHVHKHRKIKWYISRLRLCVKLPTYHSPKATFCPKWEVNVNVGLGEGWMSSFP